MPAALVSAWWALPALEEEHGLLLLLLTLGWGACSATHNPGSSLLPLGRSSSHNKSLFCSRQPSGPHRSPPGAIVALGGHQPCFLLLGHEQSVPALGFLVAQPVPAGDTGRLAGKQCVRGLPVRALSPQCESKEKVLLPTTNTGSTARPARGARFLFAQPEVQAQFMC